jgi:hypothetical protein
VHQSFENEIKMERLCKLLSSDFSCFDAGAPCVDPSEELLVPKYAAILDQMRRVDWRLGTDRLNDDGREYCAALEKSINDHSCARVSMLSFVHFSSAYRTSWIQTARWYCALGGVQLCV